MDIEILFQRTPPAGVLSAAMSVGCPTAYFTSCKLSYEEFEQVVTHFFAGGRGSRRPLPFFCAVSYYYNMVSVKRFGWTWAACPKCSSPNFRKIRAFPACPSSE